MSSIHLVVLIHGLWGSPSHLEACRQEVIAAHISCDTELRVLVASGSEGTLTYDGIEVFSSRVGYQIDTLVEEIEKEGGKVTQFSVLGYSLGGLVARYLLGLLHSRSPSFFTLHRPISFSTIATPHLGIPRYTGSVWGSLFHTLGSKLLSRTGEQLYCVDRYHEVEDGRPILEVMSDPNEVFVQAMNCFERIDIFANGIQDRTVPYPTASFTAHDPFIPTSTSSSTIEDELLVETDSSHLVIKWTNIPPSSPSLSHKAGRKWYQWRSVGHKKDRKIEKTRKPKPSRLPPFLQFRWPFNYLFYLALPFVLPVMVLLILSRFLLDSSRSRKRLAALRKLHVHPQTSKSTDTSNSSTMNSTLSPTSGTSTPSPFSPAGMSIDQLRMLIRRAERQLESGIVDVAENGGIDGDRSGMTSRSDSVEVEGLVMSRSRSPERMEDVFDDEEANFTSDRKKSKIRLNLSPAQQRMAHNLNTYLDKKKLHKYIAWFPKSHNSHAVIIVRDAKQFPMHEEGRGVIRKWARGTVEGARSGE